MQRFSFLSLIRGHFKALRDRDRPSRRIAWGVIIALYGLPIAIGVASSVTQNARLESPATILTALALLAGAFLTSFTHMSTLRGKLSDRQGDHEDTERPDRNMIDEAATHLLMGAFASISTVILIVVAMNAQHGDVLLGWAAALIIGACSWVALLLLISLPRLYNAYVEVNRVPNELSGSFKGTGVVITENDDEIERN
ncbi:hypothetical protein [Curtobacterium flaccumfaciens]|uniref:hypothetical protein n=1 Tax=Curtobacterium flaccumfaciens TaxID=2035 RepID=UPI003EBD5EB0